MEKYKFSLPQQPRFFEVEARNEEEAREILENAGDITDFEFEDTEIWQPDFELIK